MFTPFLETRDVVDKQFAYTISPTVDRNGTIFTNRYTGLFSPTVKFTLPKPKAGLTYTFYRAGLSPLAVTGRSGDILYGDSGLFLVCFSSNGHITVKGISGTEWVIESQEGWFPQFRPNYSYSTITAQSVTAYAIEQGSGRLYAWGGNSNSQLGIHTTAQMSSPVAVFSTRSFVFTGSGAGSNGCAIEGSTGAAWFWGSGAVGSNGDNTSSSRSSPISVIGGRSFSKVGRGAGSQAIEASTGNAYCWGSNTTGGVGDNSIDHRSSPVSVMGARSFKDLGSGNSAVMLEASTGNVYCWGTGTQGINGDNTTDNRSSPVSVLGGRSFKQVCSGIGFSLAIEGSTGRIYGWGSGAAGRLGDNTVDLRSSPVSVMGDRSFSQVAGAASSAIAIEASTGNAYAWGTNTSGELGDNSIANRSSPVSVVGARSWSLVAMGFTTYGIEASTGLVYAWGGASSGGIGDPFSGLVNRSSPVVIARSWTRPEGGTPKMIFS